MHTDRTVRLKMVTTCVFRHLALHIFKPRIAVDTFISAEHNEEGFFPKFMIYSTYVILGP